MRNLYFKNNILAFLLILTTLNVFSQAPEFVTPSEDQIDADRLLTIQYSSSSTGNTSSSPDEITLEYATDISFTNDFTSQLLIRKGGNTTATRNISLSSLEYGTSYFFRLVSNKNGSSEVLSYTTRDLPLLIISPSDGATDLETSVTVTIENDVEVESSSNPDFFGIEISTSSDFSSGVLTSSTFSKLASVTSTRSHTFENLEFSTTYFARGVSSLYGNGEATSFTTQSQIEQLPFFVSPSGDQIDADRLLTIEYSSSSTGNTTSLPDEITLEYATDISFTNDFTSQLLIRKGGNSTILRSIDLNSLQYGTSYFFRLVSSKYGSSETLSYTTRDLPLLITSPLDGTIDLETSVTVTLENDVEVESSSNPDFFEIEISTSSDFSSDVLISSTYSKSASVTSTRSHTFEDLEFSTTYFARGVSSLYGNGEAISFTTQSELEQLPFFVSPSEDQIDADRLLTIEYSSSSTGNTTSSPDEITLEYATDISFTNDFTSQLLIRKGGNSTILRSIDLNSLQYGTSYFFRLVSSKYGSSEVLSYTTRDLPLFITSPLDGVTDLETDVTVTIENSVEIEFSSNPDFFEIEISTSSDFSSDVLTSSTFTKIASVTSTRSHTFEDLEFSTTYFARGVSSLYGNGEVISFTTQSLSAQQPSILDPIDGTVDGLIQFFVTYSAPSTDNSLESPDLIYIEYSTDETFETGVVSELVLEKTDDAFIIDVFEITEGLDYGTTYFFRARSSKRGFSAVISYTTEPIQLFITSPVDGSTGLSSPISVTVETSNVVFSSDNPEMYFIELSTVSDFSVVNVTSDIYSKSTSATEQETFDFEDLESGTTYFVRGVSSLHGNGEAISFTVGDIDIQLTEVDDIAVSLLEDNFANSSEYTLESTLLSNNFDYRWQIDDNADFTSPEIDSTVSVNMITLNESRLDNGTEYFVRLQSINTNNAEVTDLSTATVVSYFTPLSITTLAFPNMSEPITRNAFKIWFYQVTGAEQVLLQVDDDSDFSSPHVNPAAAAIVNTTREGIEGNVFLTNTTWRDGSGFEFSDGEILLRVLDFILDVENTTYFVRSKTINDNQESDWSPTETFIVNGPSESTRNVEVNSLNQSVAYPTVFESTTLISLADLPGNTMTVEVYTDLGVLVERGEYNTATSFNLGQDYESGTYIIKVVSEINTESFRIIKQ